MSKAFAWRPLALLPILKASACAETDKDWLTERRLDLYHCSMDHIIADLNELCSKDIYLRFADNLIRLSRAFYHLLVLDGAEVAAATMCDTRPCPVCTCPHDELDRTDKAFPYRHTETVKAQVEAARREHLDDRGQIKPNHISKVFVCLHVVFDIAYDIVCDIGYDLMLHFIYFQVEQEQRRLKHKLTTENAYFKAKDFDHIACAPKEELHQFLIGLYGEHMLPATLHEYERLLRSDLYSTGVDKDGNKKYVISKKMMAGVWARLRDRLASIGSSTSMVEVSSDYAAHFHDMFVKNHDGKHMTGGRIKILLLNLPFMLRDLIAPEVMCIQTYTSFLVSYMTSYTIS